MSELNYNSYLQLDDLLALQTLQSAPEEHDEMLFIVIHQVYELWFKAVLHELDECNRELIVDEPIRASHQLRRVLRIFDTLTAQIGVLETMTPLEFDSFRAFLDRSSGFQSSQFRELEFLLGNKNPVVLGWHESHPENLAALQRRYDAPTVWDAFVHHAGQRGYPVPDEALNRVVTEPVVPMPAMQEVLVEIYQHNRSTAMLCELLVDLDEALQKWRYRHVMMVQRTIGTRTGTGGSEGAEYLRSTLFKPVFPDLWACRSRL